MVDPNHGIETTLLDGRVRCVQPRTGYRIAIDTVLMAAAVPAKAGHRLLDVGMGTGAAGLCVAARVGAVHVTGLEIQSKFANLARHNAALNGMADNFDVVNGNVGCPPKEIQPDSYDHVLSNPPFVEAGRGRVPLEPSKAMATMESSVELRDWIVFCLRMVRTKGTVTIIHRADRVEEILAAMMGKAGDLIIVPLWPGGHTPDAAAKRVIVQGRKGMKGPTTLARGLVLHKPGGDYTDAVKRIVVDAGALET